MAKKKRKHIPGSQTGGRPPKKRNESGDVITGPNFPTEEIKWWREAVEGLVVAIVLALLIRGFEAEAFVIPTGSMAPTLRGQHKDVKCSECGQEYAAGASSDIQKQYGTVTATICPVCAYPQEVEYDEGRDADFAGDRIIVNKFAYDPLGQPERFDVIVFKNPNDGHQNYIKRLCGLPGETLKLFRGDIFVNSPNTNGQFEIARKPPRKLQALLQLVDDTDHFSKTLRGAGVPPGWQPKAGWKPDADSQSFDLVASPGPAWMRYHNYKLSFQAWQALKNNQSVNLSGAKPSLITDTNAYNGYLSSRQPRSFFDRARGKNWVGDLAVETNVEIKSDSGKLILELIEGGWRFQCNIDVSTGQASLGITKPDGQPGQFQSNEPLTAATPVKRKGKHRLLFSNFDSEIRLWVDGKVIDFNHPGYYSRGPIQDELRPVYNGPDDQGDLAPVGIAGDNLAATVERIKVFRDVYYLAEDGTQASGDFGDYTRLVGAEEIAKIFRSPEQWATTPLFSMMRPEEFELKDFEDDSLDQFFPMGDNSPHSLDARLWPNKYVERQLLIGEAIFIYYPHPWSLKMNDGNKNGEGFKSIPLLFYPKFSRMGIIR